MVFMVLTTFFSSFRQGTRKLTSTACGSGAVEPMPPSELMTKPAPVSAATADGAQQTAASGGSGSALPWRGAARYIDLASRGPPRHIIISVDGIRQVLLWIWVS